eukprot:3908913-Amphidinium_carterae.1
MASKHLLRCDPLSPWLIQSAGRVVLQLIHIGLKKVDQEGRLYTGSVEEAKPLDDGRVVLCVPPFHVHMYFA